MKVKTGVEVRDHGWIAFFGRLREIRDARVKVGVLADGAGAATHPDSDLTIAQIAALLEFGTEDGRIPARPALRSTFDAMREELVDLGKELIERVLDGKIEVPRALNILGAKLANGVKRTITRGAGVPPPNAPSTIARKGSSRPWVDTGRTVNAISWAVQEGGEGSDEVSEE